MSIPWSSPSRGRRQQEPLIRDVSIRPGRCLKLCCVPSPPDTKPWAVFYKAVLLPSPSSSVPLRTRRSLPPPLLCRAGATFLWPACPSAAISHDSSLCQPRPSAYGALLPHGGSRQQPDPSSLGFSDLRVLGSPGLLPEDIFPALTVLLDLLLLMHLLCQKSFK